MSGLKDDRLDGVRIGIPIVSLIVWKSATNYAFAIMLIFHMCAGNVLGSFSDAPGTRTDPATPTLVGSHHTSRQHTQHQIGTPSLLRLGVCRSE
jgi:hypothetical protein